MNDLQKSLSTYLLATVALLVGASPAWAQVSLGAASGFSVLGGTAVTCTNSVVTGAVGVSPGSAFTNTGCTIAGGMPPATNAAAVGAHAALLSAYTALGPVAGDCDVAHTLGATIPVSRTLFPGVYCTDAALTGTNVVLTLDAQGNANAVWIFKIGTNPTGTGALTGTSFSVAMANGGQPCNVFWRVAEGVTMTTSTFKGNILAGGTTGSITLTGGTLAGRALANVAVTMTNASVIDCGLLSGPASGKCTGRDGDDDKDHKKCKEDSGKHSGDCDDDRSDQHNPFGSDDDHDGKSGGKDGKK